METPKEILDQIREIDFPQRKGQYNFIRDTDGYMKSEHRVIWERQNGKIPKGFEIHHINGNKKDNRIENLECLSRKEHILKHYKPNRIRIKYGNSTKVIKIPV